MKSKYPFVSVIIVNYNGRHLLGNCLESLHKLTYPKQRFEIIVVDNGSHDDSIAFIKQHYPGVIIKALRKNLAFTGGNNEGMKLATGDYLVLLNNDTVVSKNWLTELVFAAQPEKIGIVSSKILLDTQFLELKIESSVVQQSDLDDSTDFSPRGVLLESILAETAEKSALIWYQSGFKNKHFSNNICLRWTSGQAVVYVPIQNDTESFTVTFHGYPTIHQVPLNVKIYNGKEILFRKTLQSNEVIQESLIIKKKRVQDHLFQLVQNAGTVLLRGGYAKDRGSVLRITDHQVEEFYERDSKFYDQPQLLPAACGAGMLIKRKVINEIGLLDNNYFMYYEDVEFCLRAWKMGWDILYAPKAIMFHKHRASTGKVESSFFIHMIERNHLFFVTSHFPVEDIIREYSLFLVRLGISLAKQFIFRFKRWDLYPLWQKRATGRMEAFFSYNSLVVKLIKNRLWWNKRRNRGYTDLEPLLY